MRFVAATSAFPTMSPSMTRFSRILRLPATNGKVAIEFHFDGVPASQATLVVQLQVVAAQEELPAEWLDAGWQDPLPKVDGWVSLKSVGEKKEYTWARPVSAHVYSKNLEGNFRRGRKPLTEQTLAI